MVKIYNEYEMLEDLIISLLKQVKKPNKVYIIDDGSPNPKVGKEIEALIEKYKQIKIELIQLPLKKKPNLDTVGRTFSTTWFKAREESNYDYIATLDADTRLEPHYYRKILLKMNQDQIIGCMSGVIIVREKEQEYIEKINIGAKFGRKDARGSGKVIRSSLLDNIPDDDFPEVDWDTWINTKAKVRKMKSPQFDETYMFQERPTTRVAKKDLYRSGRLTYHFGYNPILLIMKVVIARTGGLKLLKGYWNARKNKWKLNDSEVRGYFGWKFFLHF